VRLTVNTGTSVLARATSDAGAERDICVGLAGFVLLPELSYRAALIALTMSSSWTEYPASALPPMGVFAASAARLMDAFAWAVLRYEAGTYTVPVMVIVFVDAATTETELVRVR
jgi:hypothetical protein